MFAVDFGRHRRLLAAADYSAVFANAAYKVSHGKCLILARSNGKTDARLGLVIAKKNVRFAVNRNQIKRIVREAFRHRQSDLLGVDIIFLSRKGLDTLTKKEQAQLVNQSFVQLIRKVTQNP